MSNRKIRLEDKSQWLVHQDLIDYCEGRTIGTILVLKERKGCGVIFPNKCLHHDLGCGVYIPKWGFAPWTWENCFIFIKWGSQNFGLVSQIVLTVILWGVFIPKWRFTPWTEWFVARFRIVESCFEFDENEWIVMLSVEFWVCRSSRCSSRYSSWSERYFSLKYEQKDKEQAARDLTVLVTFYEPI